MRRLGSGRKKLPVFNGQRDRPVVPIGSILAEDHSHFLLEPFGAFKARFKDIGNEPVGRANVFTLTGKGNGTLNNSNVTRFTSMENLNDVTMGDIVVVNRRALVTSITGGSGIETIQVDSNAGDTSVGVYTGISHLIGTADNASLLTGSLNGRTGTNASHYTGRTKPISIHLDTGHATGVISTTST